MRSTFLLALLVATGACLPSSSARADLFGSGENEFAIKFVPIGNPGNPPDTTDRPVTDGAVSYPYRIGKYEISEQMIDKANAEGGLGITHDGRGPSFPATSISWFEAARFVNWLNESTGAMPAYKFDEMGDFVLWEEEDPGFNPNNLYRNDLARYFLPSLDEWHKAAYYDPVAMTYYDYPTASDAIPDGIDFVGDADFDAVFFDGADQMGPNDVTNVGVPSPYGTAGQGGNVTEWLESAFDRNNSSPLEGRQRKGGSWNSAVGLVAFNDGIGWLPSVESDWFGFRVATTIPEPHSFLLCLVAFVSLVGVHRRRRMHLSRVDAT